MKQVTELHGFRGNLLIGAKNMRIVLGKGPDPHQAVQCARWFKPVTAAEFRHAQGQITVAVKRLVENLDVARTVHGLDGDNPFLSLGCIHVFAEFFPVAGFFP